MASPPGPSTGYLFSCTTQTTKITKNDSDFKRTCVRFVVNGCTPTVNRYETGGLRVQRPPPRPDQKAQAGCAQ